jgi:predicted nucleic acid-binding protein
MRIWNPMSSAQVFNEFFVNAVRKGADPFEIQSVLANYNNRFTIEPLDFHIIEKGWSIFNRYHFSYWDSLIVASALESGCSILYSEDLQDGQVIENSLKIVNPFRGKCFES